MPKTATSMMPFQHAHRRRRADMLAARIFSSIKDLVSDRARRHVYAAIIDTLMAEGAEVVTDEMRAQAGLPERGPDGVTTEELWLLEEFRIQAMQRPLTVVRDIAGIQAEIMSTSKIKMVAPNDR
jgi:hypothetical protein